MPAVPWCLKGSPTLPSSRHPQPLRAACLPDTSVLTGYMTLRARYGGLALLVFTAWALFVGTPRRWTQPRTSEVAKSWRSRWPDYRTGGRPSLSWRASSPASRALPVTDPSYPRSVIFYMRRPSKDHSDLLDTLANLEVGPSALAPGAIPDLPTRPPSTPERATQSAS
jgi:hypothetical protein